MQFWVVISQGHTKARPQPSMPRPHSPTRPHSHSPSQDHRLQASGQVCCDALLHNFIHLFILLLLWFVAQFTSQHWHFCICQYIHRADSSRGVYTEWHVTGSGVEKKPMVFKNKKNIILVFRVFMVFRFSYRKLKIAWKYDYTKCTISTVWYYWSKIRRQTLKGV